MCRPGNFHFKTFSEIVFIAWRLFFSPPDFIFAVPLCPIEFPSLPFPTELGPHLVLVGERSSGR